MHERLLTRHFLQRFVDNDLISPDADRHEILSVTAAVLVSSTLFATVLLSAKYLFLPFPSPARVVLLAVQDRFFFITLTMAVMGLVAVAVWDALVLDARDTEILGPLPVPRRSIVRAKAAAVLLFAAGFVVAVTAVPTLLYPILMAGRLPIGFGGLVRLTIAHAAVTVLAGAFAFMTVLAIREGSRAICGDRLFGQVSALVQGTLLVGFATTLLVLPALPAAVVQRALVVDASILYFMPPAWFVGLLEAMTAGTIADLPSGDLPAAILDLEQRAMALYRSQLPLVIQFAPIAIGGAVSVLLVASTTYAWNAWRTPLPPPPAERTSPRRFDAMVRWTASRVVVRSAVAQAGFFFTLQCLWRSLPHRLSILAAGAVGLAVSAVGLYGAQGLRQDELLSGEVPAAVFATQTLMVIALLLGFRHAARVPASLPASWVFRLALSGSHDRYRAGVRRAAVAGLCIPVLLVLFVSGLAVMELATAVGHLLCGLVVGLIVVELVSAGIPALPFTSAYMPSGSVKGTAPIVAVTSILAAYTLAWFEQRTLVDQKDTAILLAVLVLLFIAVAPIARWCARDRDERLRVTPDEALPSELQRLDLNR